MKILAVEDDERCARCLARMLSGNEVAVVSTIADARCALEECSDGRPMFDAVVCDLHLPDGTGEALLRDLQRGGDLHAARFIICSGGPRTAGEEAFAALLDRRFLFKPVGRAQMIAALAELSVAYQPGRI